MRRLVNSALAGVRDRRLRLSCGLWGPPRHQEARGDEAHSDPQARVRAGRPWLEVLPALGVALNLLSGGAAYGLLVLVFQHGIGASLLGFQKVDTLEAWLPLFLFSVLFGLSMDYQVFLLSRIQERYGHSGDHGGRRLLPGAPVQEPPAGLGGSAAPLPC